MDKVFIFDVDGTLTPSRLPMTQDFTIFFSLWSMNNPFYLVTGSDLKKTKEQVPWYILERAKAVFTCCGNEMWKNNEQIYRNEFKPSQDLIDFLWDKVNNSMYPIRIGNHIEDRETMVNFSVVGRDCSQEQREEYYIWDKTSHERKKIAKQIKEQWNELDAVIGGEISIDIYPKGKDKSQVLNIIEQERLSKTDKYIFIGDGINNKGNDWALAELMLTKKDYCSSYQTSGWKETKKILENFSD